jgi:hypothetical protein
MDCLWRALAERLGKPVRLLNDAEVQGLNVIMDRRLDVVLTPGPHSGASDKLHHLVSLAT